MKLSPNLCALFLVSGTILACGRLETQNVQSLDDNLANLNDSELEEYNLSLPVTDNKIGSIYVKRNLSVQWAGMPAPEPAFANTVILPEPSPRCLLLAGSYLSSVKSDGLGSFTATVELPKKIVLPKIKNHCKQAQQISIKAHEKFAGLAFTASETSFKNLVVARPDVTTVGRKECFVSPLRRNIRISGGVRGEFHGSVVAASPVEAQLNKSGECAVDERILVDSIGLQKALSKQPLPQPPIHLANGTIHVEKESLVTMADVAIPAIYPKPPAPRCLLAVGARLKGVKSNGKGTLSAYVDLPPTAQVALGKNYCTQGRFIVVSAKDEFVGLAITAVDSSFALQTVAQDGRGEQRGKCIVTAGRRNFRIKGRDAASGAFTASVVAANEIEDMAIRNGECKIGEKLIADTVGIQNALTLPGFCGGGLTPVAVPAEVTPISEQLVSVK